MENLQGAKRWLFRASLLLPTVVLLLVLEAGARLHAWHSDSTLQRGLGTLGSAAASDDLSLQHLIRWHENPRIIYDLVPGLRGTFRGRPLTINAQGFRGPPVARAKPDGTLRIAGIGDSVMFGWGVGDDEPYLAGIGDRLAAALPERRVDWVNAAVPGYNTVNEVETLEQKLLDYTPDVVILGYVNNDLYPPGFLRKRQPYFAMDRSFLAQFVRNALDGLHVPDNELERPPDAFRHRTFLGEEALIPDAYREVIGIHAFETAIERLAELAKAHRF
ncbi:MAG TPA: GDSL-type esterase/lipase family protein, partial [Pseudomonadales bacterium]